MINKYVDHLLLLHSKYQYTADCVLNFDETPVVFEKKNKKVILVKEDKKLGVKPSLDHRWRFTMGVSICADGSMLEPLIILNGKYLPDLPDYLVNWGLWKVQKNAWIDTSIFADYIRQVVFKWTKEKKEELKDEEERKKKRFLLVVDRHSSRNNEELLNEMSEEGIDVVFFPPHTSHVCQPLDIGIFGGFKSMIHRKLDRRIGLNDDFPNRRLKTLETAFECIECMCNRWNIRKAFNLAGINPLNRDILMANPLIGTCPTGLEGKLEERLEAFTVSGEYLAQSLSLKRIEKEKKECEKKRKRVNKEEEGTIRKMTNKRVRKNIKNRKKSKKLDWTQLNTSDSELQSESEKSSEEEEFK